MDVEVPRVIASEEKDFHGFYSTARECTPQVSGLAPPFQTTLTRLPQKWPSEKGRGTIAFVSNQNHDTAAEIDQLLQRLFPICRSITGEGVRQTLAILGEHLPLKIHEVPSGTRALDWTVPREWNITDAFIKAPDGKKIVDFKKNNLHVVGYSTPVRATMSLAALRPHLYSLPEAPDLIPHRTSYYNPDWGFCLTDTQLQSLKEGTYEVVIDSTLADGSLTYGELFLPGESKDEVLLSCYVCHPSMANDNLSGVVLLTFLAKRMLKEKHRYSYRLLFIPETIGALVWLAKNRKLLKKIQHGLVATCVGDNGDFTYKKSRRGNAEIDRVVAKTLADTNVAHEILEFFPQGSDERQYCSPGFNLPVGSLMRTMYYRFPQYHTSSDDLTFVKGEYLAQTLALYEKVLSTLERNRTYKNLAPYGEPQLGKRGLYSAIGGVRPSRSQQEALMWVLNFSDGKHSLLDIAERSEMDFDSIHAAAETLRVHKLLKSLDERRK